MIRRLDANLLIAVADMDHFHAATARRFVEHNAVREVR